MSGLIIVVCLLSAIVALGCVAIARQHGKLWELERIVESLGDTLNRVRKDVDAIKYAPKSDAK